MTWVVNDGTVSSNIAASTITVMAVNSSPIGVADAWTTFGNTELVVDQAGPATPFVADTTTSTFGVLDNDTDPEGDPRRGDRDRRLRRHDRAVRLHDDGAAAA